MKNCPKCSTENNDEDGQKFCSGCGTSLQGDLEKLLESLGLAMHWPLFELNDLKTIKDLRLLDDQNFNELGIPYGDKIRIRKAMESSTGHGSHNIPMERAALISVQIPKTKEYLVPNLKPDKLAKAINHYAPSVNVADVLLHADTTFWGSAKDGFILTYSHLYASSDKLKIKVLPVTDISKIEYTNNDSTVYVNGEAFFHCKAGSFSSPAVIVPIIDAVRFILKLDN
jgi:hypothetical protein